MKRQRSFTRRDARYGDKFSGKRVRLRGSFAKQTTLATLAHAAETKYVDGFLDAVGIHELSANDDTWADTEINPRQQTAVYGCLPVPQQGDNYSDRNGRKIFIKNIKIRGVLSWAKADTVTAAIGQSFVRLVVVKDTRTNGVSLSGEDVLAPGLGSDGQASLTADAAIMSLTNPNGWGRFQIVKEKIVRINPQTAFNDGTDGAVNGYEVPFKMNVKCGEYVNFDAAAGAIASVVDNSYHLLAAASQSDGQVTVSYVARTAFVG